MSAPVVEDVELQGIIAAAHRNYDSTEVVELAGYETVCVSCWLVHNRHLPCTNCSGKG